MSSPRWIAFLRAVNVGARRLPSAQLRKVCARLGLREVRTHLQTGNVSFEAPPGGVHATLAHDLGAALEAAAGFEEFVMVRDVGLLQATLDSPPFAAVEITAQTRLFVVVLGAPLPAEPPLRFDTARHRILASAA